jgi:hypothetical protein
MALENLKDHLMSAVATAAVLGGGTAIFTDHVAISRQDVRIERIEKLDERMTKLDERLVATQLALAKVSDEPR